MSLRVVFMGSPEFAVPPLRALHANFQLIGVFTQKDRPKGRGRKTVPTAVKSAALEMGLTVVEPETLTSQDTIDQLARWNPDAIVVAAYGKILPQSILQFPRMGCINLHASLLPRHRGASPISAAILDGDEVTGVCTMVMDRGMDTGDILLSMEIPIGPEDTAGSLHDKLMEPGANLVVETLRRLAEGTIQPTPQDHSAATYTRLLTKQDGRVEWQRDADYLCRLVRAVNPWPGAYCDLDGITVKVWEASTAEGASDPGCVEAVTPDGIAVGTGRGLLVLKEVQAPGKRRVSGSEFARGRRLMKGTVLA